MKKVILLAMVTIFIISISGLAIAAPEQSQTSAAGNWYCPYYGQYYNNLTDDQKTQIASWQKEALDQKKQILAKRVEWGWITQAQADQQISWMEQQIANGAYGNGPMVSGYGMMGGTGGGGGRGCW